MTRLLVLFCLLAQLGRAQELTVAAAASLEAPLHKIDLVYHAARLTLTYGSSGALQKQIENGAPIDVFISASVLQMDVLEAEGLILAGSRTNFLSNQLVLIVPKDFKGVSSFRDLTNAAVRHIALGEPRSVPVGQYAAQTLKYFNLTNAVQPKAVYGADVRQVLTYVENGDAEAGIVYQSDAQSSDKVQLVATAPPESHKPIIYCAAIVKRSLVPQLGAGFIQLLGVPAARRIFRELGFTPDVPLP